MQIWPAIDILGGNCVRLTQGDYRRERIYDSNPAEVARRWVDEGARHLHLVDLDGARDGCPRNSAAVLSIANGHDVETQIGGGIRDDATAEMYLDAGIDRIVIGTGALGDEAWFRDLCTRFPGRVVLGIDSRNGQVATHGWLTTSQLPAKDLAQRFADLSLAGIVHTDIGVDGTLNGPNLELLAEIQAVSRWPVIASGGVRDRGHVEALAAAGVQGAILGRCLYEQTLRLSEALEAAASVQTS